MVLILNLIFYILWLAHVIHKEKITPYSLLLSLYTIVAFLGVVTVYNGIYFDVFGYKDVKSLELLPYVYSAITFVLILSPLRGIRIKLDDIGQIVSPKSKLIVNAWIIYFIPYTLLKISEMLFSLAMGLGDAYDARHIDGEALFVYDNYFLRVFNNMAPFILNATLPFIMIYSIIALFANKITQLKASFLIILCFLPSVAKGIAGGSRGSMFLVFFNFFLFILLLWRYIPRLYMKKIYIAVISTTSTILAYSWIITVARFGENNSNDGINSILRYFGEAFPNLGFNFWGKVIRHPMGERKFTYLFDINESQLYSSTYEMHRYWEGVTGVPVINFTTFFGDLYIEFGTVLTFVFTLVLVLLMKYFLKDKKVTLYNIGFIYYYYQMCVYAFAGFAKGGQPALMQMLFIIAFSIFLKSYLPQQHKKILISRK